MGKKLPTIRKSLKSFILEEDAKVIDKTATKVAIAASFMAFNFAANLDDANAKGHCNHTNHSNHIFHEEGEVSAELGSYDLGGCPSDGSSNVVHIDPGFNNPTNESASTRAISLDGKFNTGSEELPAKSFTAAHANHHNKVDDDDYGCW